MIVRRLGLAAALLGTLAVAAACSPGNAGTSTNPAGVQISTVPNGSPWHGAELPEPYSMPNVTLTDDDGRPYDLRTKSTSGVTLVFFGYTNCPDVCPLVMSDLASTYLRLPATVRAETRVLFITTDPQRDTGSALRSYLDRFNPSFIGLTGNIATIKAAARALGVAITGTKRLPDGGYDVAHSSQVIGFRGRSAPVIWTPGTPVPEVVEDIDRLAGQA